MTCISSLPESIEVHPDRSLSQTFTTSGFSEDNCKIFADADYVDMQPSTGLDTIREEKFTVDEMPAVRTLTGRVLRELRAAADGNPTTQQAEPQRHRHGNGHRHVHRHHDKRSVSAPQLTANPAQQSHRQRHHVRDHPWPYGQSLYRCADRTALEPSTRLLEALYSCHCSMRFRHECMMVVASCRVTSTDASLSRDLPMPKAPNMWPRWSMLDSTANGRKFRSSRGK